MHRWVFLPFLVPVIMGLMMLSPVVIPENHCHIAIQKHPGSTEYTYSDSRERFCGSVLVPDEHLRLSYGETTYAYAFPAQPWNFTVLDGKDYYNPDEAIEAVGRIRKVN